ncbi:hypothetical protein J4E81_001847 [Alternaria sp. BMP 2799]|nr:hypothetical protein J4E81_001847 [Alternaria sp. BMP 2799]
MLQQAQAAASAVQTETAGSTRHDSPLQTTDLVTPDATDEEVPPPPYGDIYGEIRNEKDGLGTSASVTEDGRVNIRINQLNRRLSQVFTPALREHVQSVQESSPPLPAYIPPSLGGKEGVPPPALNVVIQVVGSRGDVQPFVALGKVLKETYGHRVRLATHPTFKEFVEENGLEFFSIGGDPSQLMAFMVKNPGLMPGDGITDDDSSDRSSNDVGSFPFVADCIIANPPSFAHIHCVEKLGIPLHIMFTMPYSPTQAFPHPLANIQSSNADTQLTNYISYAMIEALSWQGLGDIINRFRAKCLGLEPVSMMWAPGMLQRLKVPHTYCWSPALIPKPKDWGSHISISGFYFLNLASNYTPTPELQKFLDDGPPPVYIGFGSIVLDNPNAMTELIFEATKKIAGGRRVLLSKGWGGMGVDELRVPENVFMLGNVPHDWLFKHVECVVHHGGAGTTAAGIAAGRPTIIIPFFGDQPFWGAMIARAGAGPDPIPYRQLTSDKLADAINFCLKPESLERAKDLASKIATERGSDMGAQSFHQYLDLDRLRCNLAPSRVAVWRIKRTQIRLSAFAACTLANAGLLDFHDLKLFRAQEYATDEGPLEPISGFGMGILRTLGSMSMGIAEMPSETAKAVQAPFGPSRQQSDTSVRNAAKRSEPSLLGESSTSSSSQQHPHPSAMERKPLARSQTTPNLSTPASRAPSVASSSSKDNDMLRPTGLRTSRGFGRIVKAGVQSPMELSVGITKGFHNAPKLWNDTTVRPQEKVSDLKSGMVAIGREFGFGWYDGVTGLFTQPWKGAQKEGASGFFKGVGKGIGGFIAKPGAALFGIPSHMMKGVHKEVQKRFGSSVQTYIVTSRTAQGCQEWVQSGEEEKEDVVERWGLIQKYLKRKDGLDEMMKDVLDAQRKGKAVDESTADSVRSADASIQDVGSGTLTSHYDPHTVETSSEASLRADSINEPIHQSSQNMPRADAEAGSSEELLHAMVSSEVEAQQHSREAVEYEKQLKQAMAQSLQEQRQTKEDNGCKDLDSERAGTSEATAATMSDGLPGAHRPPLYDPGHVAGTTQGEFQAQHRGEKTMEEKTEEEIVMAYVKKQSLLEAHHQSKGKGRAPAREDEDEEELQKALSLSMQRHE